MNMLTPFQFESHALRVQIDDSGQPWFNANDVCAALELANPSDAVSKHVDADDLAKREVIDSLGRTQRANHVNESGLYALILGSTKDAAKRFKRWVTSEVLPTIRKTGSYVVPALASLPAPTQDRVTALLLIGEAVAKVPGVKAGIAMHPGKHRPDCRDDAPRIARGQRANLLAQCDPARQADRHLRQGNQPAPGQLRSSVPQ